MTMSKLHRTNDASLERSINQLSDAGGSAQGVAVTRRTSNSRSLNCFVARQADRWKVAKAAGELASLLKDSGGNTTEQFLKEEAIDSIRDALNLSFAQIDQILQKEEVKRIVAAKPPRTGFL